MPDSAHNGVAGSIDEERRKEICRQAESWANEGAGSLYPIAEESQSVLLGWGQNIARECGLTDAEADLFASTYASRYLAELDCLDTDYEAENEKEEGFITARLIRMADLDPLAIFLVQTPAAERSYQTYRQARRAYNACRRTHTGANLALVRYVDADHRYRRGCIPLLACGSFKWEREGEGEEA